MASRVARLWQPGNPQVRVFLPDFWIKLLETPKMGASQLPKNAALFEVDLKMSDDDVRQYLEKIYKLPVRDVRTRVEFGEIEWDIKDERYRRAMWRDEHKKFATVFFKKGVKAEIPDLFAGVDPLEKDIDNMKDFVDRDINRHNANYANKDRHGVGKFFGV